MTSQVMLYVLLLLLLYCTVTINTQGTPKQSYLNSTYFITSNSNTNTIVQQDSSIAPQSVQSQPIQFTNNNSQFFVYYITLVNSNEAASNTLSATLQATNNPAVTWSIASTSNLLAVTIQSQMVNFGQACTVNNQCSFTLQVTNTGNTTVQYTIGYLTGKVLIQGQSPGAATLQRTDYAMYGYYVFDGIMPVTITVTPNVNQPTTDLDQYLSTEFTPFTFFMPTAAAPDYTMNQVETYTMNTNDPNYRTNELIIQLVVAPSDTGTTISSYTVLEIYTDSVGSVQLFGLGLFALGGALVVLTLCVLSTLVVCYRRRRAARLLEQWQRDHPNQPLPGTYRPRGARRGMPVDFGATDDEIKQYTQATIFHKENIPTESTYNNTDTTPTCTICLAEYQEDEPLMLLQCGHYYHHQCGENWLKRRKVCSLCLRPIDAVIVNRTSNAAENSPGISPVSTTQNNTSTDESHSIHVHDISQSNNTQSNVTVLPTPVNDTPATQLPSISNRTTESTSNIV